MILNQLCGVVEEEEDEEVREEALKDDAEIKVGTFGVSLNSAAKMLEFL